MRGRSMGEITLKLKNILQRINELAEQRKSVSVPKLIAVSKTKPIEAIVELYKCGQYTFGENYVQELEEKANNEQIKRECPDIRWHYIGHLQRNKCNRIVKIPNLECIQTIDSIQLADSLNNACKNVQFSKPLNILLQINTSNEEQKSGIAPNECLTLYQHVKKNCELLNCLGLMTIGALDNVQSTNNQDFEILLKCRDNLCEQSSLSVNDVELSMGMSSDYEQAILAGSTMVRIGSSLFGGR